MAPVAGGPGKPAERNPKAATLRELTHPDDRQSDLDATWRILNGEQS